MVLSVFLSSDWSLLYSQASDWSSHYSQASYWSSLFSQASDWSSQYSQASNWSSLSFFLLIGPSSISKLLIGPLVCSEPGPGGELQCGAEIVGELPAPLSARLRWWSQPNLPSFGEQNFDPSRIERYISSLS